MIIKILLRYWLIVLISRLFTNWTMISRGLKLRNRDLWNLWLKSWCSIRTISWVFKRIIVKCPLNLKYPQGTFPNRLLLILDRTLITIPYYNRRISKDSRKVKDNVVSSISTLLSMEILIEFACLKKVDYLLIMKVMKMKIMIASQIWVDRFLFKIRMVKFAL